MAQIVEGEHYTVTQWRARNADSTPSEDTSHPNMECTKCDYKTLFPEKMQKHWDMEARHRHVWKGPTKRPASASREKKTGPIPAHF